MKYDRLTFSYVIKKIKYNNNGENNNKLINIYVWV